MSFSEPDAGATVLSTDGREAYELHLFKGARRPWECTCATFRTLGRNCKHMDAAKLAITGKKVPGVVRSWCNLP